MVDDMADKARHAVGDPTRSLNVTWSDPIAALELALTMSRGEMLAALTSAECPKSPIAELLGFDVLEAKPGRVVLGLQPREHHCNAIGVVAAGVAATVLDTAMWIAVQTSVPDHTVTSTVDLTMHLVRQLSTAVGGMHAEARTVHVGGTSCLAESRLVDASGTLYAYATAGLISQTSHAPEVRKAENGPGKAENGSGVSPFLADLRAASGTARPGG
jgi:uncharacterized protein (TIGR00369 family)